MGSTDQSWEEGDCAVRYNRTYQCRGYPYSAWCGSTDPSSMYGLNAWELTGGKALCRAWTAGDNWGENDCAVSSDATDTTQYCCKGYTDAVYCITIDPTGEYSELGWVEGCDGDITAATYEASTLRPSTGEVPGAAIGVL